MANGVETATFHVLTPYPGTELHRRLHAQGRILHTDWDLYDTRHAVFRPARMTVDQLEEGYRRAYRSFYSWPSLVASAQAVDGRSAQLRHLAYAAGWKKFERAWSLAVRARRLGAAVPLLESLLEHRSVVDGTLRGSASVRKLAT